MENAINFIKPELIIVAPVLYIIGVAAKNTLIIKDKYIPLTLGIIGVFLAVLWVFSTSDMNGYKDVLTAVFVAFTQGILCAGCSVYANQLYKQGKRDE